MSTSAIATRRPKTGKGIQIGMRWPLAVLDEIDAWASAQPDKPQRAEAILRLIKEALSDTTDKKVEMPPSSLTDAPKAEGASRVAPVPMAPQPRPQSETCTQHDKVEDEQPARKVRWTPRLVETTRLPEPKAQVPSAVTGAAARSVTTPRPQGASPASKPAGDDRPYDMPEDIKAFNDYWAQAERMVGRRLEYEEVVVSYNRYRHGI
jgi:hypothetical protein